jgi:hypothetical protein
VLRPYGQRRSESWVWLSWIIPIVNLWFPKQLIDDALAATAPGADRPPPRTGLWWTAWILMSVLSIAQAALSLFPPNTALHVGLLLVDAVVTTGGLVHWVRIVRYLSDTQDALVARQR